MTATRRPAHGERASRRHRSDVLYLVAAAAILAGAFWVVVTLQGLAADLHTANQARDLLARQVQQLGAKPVAGPPGSRGKPGQSVTGPRGPEGEPGSPGPSGSPGKDGKNGKNGDDGSKGTSGIGTTGPSGAAGSDGAAGPPGPQGEPGPAGPEGPAGKDGTDGKDGQPCPDGYSFQAPADDPNALVCRRDGAPQPEQKNSTGLLSLGLDPQRRQYT